MSTPQSIRKACEALYEAMAQLDSFEDRQEPASPTTRGSFKQCLETLQELAVAKGFVTPSRRSRHSASPDQDEAEEASQDDSQEPKDTPSPEKPSERRQKTAAEKIQAKADKARKLTISFLNKQGLNPWPAGKIKALLCLPLSGTKKKQELEGVERLLCGIEWLEEEGWSIKKSLFDGISADTPIAVADHQTLSERCDSDNNRMSRLLKRHAVLTTSAHQETALHIVQTILSKINAIRFAEDFDLLNQVEKSTWLEKAYIQQHYGELNDLSEAAKKDILHSERGVVNAWKKQVGRITTARNRLRALFVEYGAMVLLDPVWNMRSLLNHQGHDLHKVLMSLPSKLVGMRVIDPPDSPHPLAILQPSIEHAVVCIVEALAGVSAAAYVNEFLDEYAPQLRIPRDEQFD